MSRLSQSAAATLLGVTTKTVQNWEQGLSRIPYAAFKLLRILKGYELPDKAWEGWTVKGNYLNAPNGRYFDVESLAHLEQVFSMARLWRQSYALSGKQKPPSTVLPFPDLRNASKANSAKVVRIGKRGQRRG
jgi:transcriptional regulator with XRE-family HTH domain